MVKERAQMPRVLKATRAIAAPRYEWSGALCAIESLHHNLRPVRMGNLNVSAR
jgi:hypothetical protein